MSVLCGMAPKSNQAGLLATLWGCNCQRLIVGLGKFPFQWFAPFPCVLWAESHYVIHYEMLVFSVHFFRFRDASENWQTGTCILVLATHFLRSYRHYSRYNYHYQHQSHRWKLQWASGIAIKVTKTWILKITFNIASILSCTFRFPTKILYKFLLPISRFAPCLSKPLFSTKVLKVHVSTNIPHLV
jgi:hypothetical protein